MGRIKMKSECSGRFTSECGLTLKREHGKTPDGSDINNRWVLRDKDGNWIDVNKYANDLADRNNLDLYSLNRT